MKRPAMQFLACCLTAAIASLPGFAIGAEDVEAQQELVSVKSAEHVLSAVWTKRPDSYNLRLVIDRSMPMVAVDIRNELKLVPQNTGGARPQPIPNWPVPDSQGNTPSEADRRSFFIGNTIANLRGLDPVFYCRTLTLIDRRRTVPGREQGPFPITPHGLRDRRVEVWLLNAVGTQILPTTYSCEDSRKTSPTGTDVAISYGFAVADGEQAVAVAIRVGEGYFIEKLQPLAAPAQP